MENNFKPKKLAVKAFSLLEILIVVAIIGIMSSIIFLMSNSLKDKSAVESAAREVAVAIREAQQFALTGAGAGNGCLDNFSYGVSDNRTYSINGCMDREYVLKNGVTFSGGGYHERGSFSFTVPFASMAGSNGEVLFPDPAVCAGGGAENCSFTFDGKYIDIILKRGSAFYHVCLYPSGRVEEKPETTDVDGADCQ